VQPEAKNSRGLRDYTKWAVATEKGEIMPKTVTYRKDAATGFFSVLGYNGKADHAPN
jgi:hypothetical protein